MNTASPTTPSFLSPAPVPAVVLADGAKGTAYSLDLRTKFGAWLYVRIGRRVTTALTRSGYVMIRPSANDAVAHPGTAYDRLSSTAAAGAATTLASGASAGAETISVASATGLAVGDTLCLHSPDSSANRVEWARVMGISGTTITLEEPLKTAHNSADAVSNGADVFDRMWLPGGDKYTIRAVNPSGQALVFEVQGSTDDSVTIV